MTELNPQEMIRLEALRCALQNNQGPDQKSAEKVVEDAKTYEIFLMGNSNV